MKRISSLLAALTALCLLCSLPGAALSQTAETAPVTAQTGGWPEEMIGSWVGLHENLWRQYSFFWGGTYRLTVFEDPSLDSTGSWETLGKDYSVAVDGDQMQLTARGTTGAFRRIESPYFRVKARDQTAAPSVNQRLMGTWGGRIKGTYVEWTFGADGSFSQVTPAEASVQEGYYIAGGLELAIKMGGEITHCAYLHLIRQDTVTVDLPDEGKVILNRKPGQLEEAFFDYNGNVIYMWQWDREPKGEIVRKYVGSETEVGMSLGGYSPVVGICNEAFKGNKTVLSVTIPTFAVEIGSAAFEGCESLQNVLLIGEGTDMGGWTIGDSMDTFVIRYGKSLIPGGVALKTIGEGAFRGCVRLENLNIAKSARESLSFQYVGRSDIKGINLPDGLETIGAYAFEGCQSVTCISIPDSVTEIGMNAFKGCDRVTLIVSKESYPMRYARNYGIPFILRGE